MKNLSNICISTVHAGLQNGPQTELNIWLYICFILLLWKIKWNALEMCTVEKIYGPDDTTNLLYEGEGLYNSSVIVDIKWWFY